MSFLFVICQTGAEAALKADVSRRHSAFRFAYSRPGFVTFKIPDDVRRDRRFELHSVFARTWGFSIGKVTGIDGHQLAVDFWALLTDRFPPDDLAKFTHLHVWERDRQLPGDNDFEPGLSPLADEISGLIDDARPDFCTPTINDIATSEERVLDCVLVEPGEWWIGWHRVHSTASAWPGGVPLLPDMPDDCVSRTWLKMMEALQWSGLPIESGDNCVEIGSSPGGACQALLKRGLRVTGIDPAEMHETLQEHPYFRHIRGRAKDVKRREFKNVKWLMSDASVVPTYTLDTVEAIVTHESVRIEGLLLTLKMTTLDMAADIPEYHKRVRSWGFRHVRSRQLAYNRREICLAATDLKPRDAESKPIVIEDSKKQPDMTPTEKSETADSGYDAILLLSFGGPEGRDDVIPFLENVLRGKNVPRERMLEVAEHYYHFDGVSPINAQCRDLRAGLRKELAEHGIDLPVYWGNRNWAPLLPDTLAEMKAAGIHRVLAFATAAYSSYSSCRQYLEDIENAQEIVADDAPVIDKIRVFYNHPDYIAASTDAVSDALGQMDEDRRNAAHIAFTAHSIPNSMSDQCEYVAQLSEASRLVAEAAGVSPDRWQLVYQSRSGPPQVPWLEPDICDHLRDLHTRSVRDVVVMPIGFLSDHMEVLFDLDVEAKDVCAEIGLNMVRASTVATHPRFVPMIRKLIEERVTGTEPETIGQFGPGHNVCPLDCCPRPQRPGRPAPASG